MATGCSSSATVIFVRDEIVRLTARIKELEKAANVPHTDSETMTDAVQHAPPVSQSPTTLDPVDPNQRTGEQVIVAARSSPQAASPAMPLSPVHSLPDQLNGFALNNHGTQMTMSTPMLTSPLCVSVESKVTGQPMYLSQEALNHMQACQNEAFIWRTKAAQLEIVVKDQMVKANRIEEALRAELMAARAGQIPVDEVPKTSTASGEELVVDTPTRVSPVSFECNTPSCIEKKKELMQENSRLLEQVEEVNTRIHELEDDVTALRHDLESVEEHRDRLKQQLDAATKERDSKTAEVAACDVITRHQNEKDTMQKAIAYMEERMQVYQNTLMEHDLVVSDENSNDWRKGFVDPRYNIMLSKRVQTDLTSDDLTRHETEFMTTKRKLTELHEEFTTNRSDLHGRFEEIEKILLTKTQLVETLSKQLEDTCRDQRQQIDSHQDEREAYKKCEKSEFELRFSAQREEMEHALEEALSEALAKYKEQTDYWTNKHAALEQTLERAKQEVAMHIKEKEDMKIKSKLELADLERRLTSSIDHVAMLNSQMNKSKRDVECEARPRHVSKYVACRPNSRSKSTTITKGELFDENEERLKLCQGELATTRRQVHVLQQKLITVMQEKADKRVQIRRRIPCVVEREPEPQKVDVEKIEALQTKNAELREQVTTSESHLVAAEEEKSALVRSERERIRHLVSEFENVRRELDQEMSRYQSEKTWLKSRIHNLETDNEELQRTIEARAEGSTTSRDTGSFRKTLSEPELGHDDEETARLRAENITLKRELDRIRDSLRRTASVMGRDRSHLSPAFATLADDLNVVKSDLEQILNSMEGASSSTCDKLDGISASPIHGRTPIEDEEQLQSNILETVMMGWEADEKQNLVRDLKRSRQERDVMKTRIERLSHELSEARAELEVYRREGVIERHVTAVRENVPHVVRSSSASNLAFDVIDKDEIRKWKEKCGTMFRELNAMRSGYRRAQEERRELKIQLAMLRGELEMTRCQSERDADTSMDSSVYFSPYTARSRSYHAPSELRRESRSSVIIHQNPAPFDRGSTRESVVCRITAAKSQSGERGRSRSEQRRRATSTRIDFEAKERRRSARTNVPPSLSSSITSLPGNHLADTVAQMPRHFMTQSWHESSQQRSVFFVESKAKAPQPVENRRESRVISLRERVGQLSRENRTLHEQLAAANATIASNKAAASKTIDVERLNRLEQEKDALRGKIELLLAKIEQDSSNACSALADLNARLELSRQENTIYEKKLRDLEEERREMYLVMFKKGQEAAAMDMKEVAQIDQMTQDRVVLRFLHDAFYYYLLNKGDAKEHLQAIMTMLDFSAEQKDEVAKKRGRSH
ncbi:GRIP domain protein [Ostertagia ostertagi]